MPSLAALNSWSREYTDQGILAAFQEHVKSNFSRVKTKSSELPLYARLIAIIQSSGTGKSRLMDEMAKRFFKYLSTFGVLRLEVCWPVFPANSLLTCPFICQASLIPT